jgi:adenylosuccinate synthase
MTRKNSFAFCGGAYGDEGKGRIIDKFVNDYAKKGEVVVYRDNGGAGAGHTVEFEDGTRIALHQVPSGIFVKGTSNVLGKGMVIHPQDLVEEIRQIREVAAAKKIGGIIIDEMAVLSLDTHRAFESTLKEWQDNSKGATGRGISPAYADVLFRHPLRMRDLKKMDREVFKKHYEFYKALTKGLGRDLDKIEVPILGGNGKQTVGSFTVFYNRLKKAKEELEMLIKDVYVILEEKWNDTKVAFVFEKAQAIGLHPLWGVYPDVTASETTFEGIYSSTEGIIEADEIGMRVAVVKATYMSSVGYRKLPTAMEEKLATRIREDANEYGATTKRPRDIAYLDIPAISFFCKVGQVNKLALTHMDVVYPGENIKVCVSYEIGGKKVEYRPDQEFLNKVKPVYKEFKSWNKETVRKAKNEKDLPKEAREYLEFIEKSLEVPVAMITTGPKREQGMMMGGRE